MPIKCGHSIITTGCKTCNSLQEKWYRKLKGFEDIEDKNFQLLKKWTGISDTIADDDKKVINIIDLIQSQAPDKPLGNCWPQTNFCKEEELLNHPEFEVICQKLFKHRNNAINASTMLGIWRAHCEGLSLREIEAEFNIHNTTIFRAIKKLEDLMNIMDLDPIETVVIRPYESKSDDPFLFSSWRNSVWFDAHTNNQIDPVFYRQKTKEIKILLNIPGVETRMACLKNNPDQIVGYSVLNHNTLEFVYVKLDYRNQGVAKLLAKGFLDIAKPCTKIGNAIKKNHNLKEKHGITERAQDKEA